MAGKRGIDDFLNSQDWKAPITMMGAMYVIILGTTFFCDLTVVFPAFRLCSYSGSMWFPFWRWACVSNLYAFVAS